MNRTQADLVADALLWEGYLLYPYRASALKNRHRWQIGIVSPRDGARGEGQGDWLMQTECLVEPGGDPVVAVRVRHLQLRRRALERRDDSGWTRVTELTVRGRRLAPWDEGVPRAWDLPVLRLRELGGLVEHSITVPASLEVEEIEDAECGCVGRWIRRTSPISVVVITGCTPAGPLLKLTVRIENRTSLSELSHEDADPLLASLASTHTLLTVEDGAFVSPLDPPSGLPASAACTNLRTWPVLIGEAPDRSAILSSPIIVSDYPAVAPESDMDMHDATEIDELLSLRVLTLTDQERRDAMVTDARAGAILDSAKTWSASRQERLHGAVREARGGAPAAPAAWAELLDPVEPPEPARTRDGALLSVGTSVRIRPHGRADAMDMFLEGRAARVAALHRDIENRSHVAVVVDGAAADLHASEGRFFYFDPEELESVDGAADETDRSSPAKRVLVAGIGNIFLGDDGFGCAVADLIGARTLPAGVRVEDFGIRGVHLAHEILDGGYDDVILIDAVRRGDVPGTLFLIEPEIPIGATPPTEPADAHSMSPEVVLAYLRRLGGTPPTVLVVGCEPEEIRPEMGLSSPVTAALDGAVSMVCQLLAQRRS